MPTEPTPIVAGSTEISAPGAALRVSRVDLTEVGRAMLQTQAPGLPAVAMTPELLNDYDRHSNRMHTHAALPPAASMPYSTDEPFAYFQRHPRSGTWEEVIPAAAGQPGVAAAYSAATVTRLRAEVEALRGALEPMTLNYCEARRLCLHPMRAYVFQVDDTCASCAAMFKEYREGWDAAMKEPTP